MASWRVLSLIFWIRNQRRETTQKHGQKPKDNIVYFTEYILFPN